MALVTSYRSFLSALESDFKATFGTAYDYFNQDFTRAQISNDDKDKIFVTLEMTVAPWTSDQNGQRSIKGVLYEIGSLVFTVIFNLWAPYEADPNYPDDPYHSERSNIGFVHDRIADILLWGRLNKINFNVTEAESAFVVLKPVDRYEIPPQPGMILNTNQVAFRIYFDLEPSIPITSGIDDDLIKPKLQGFYINGVRQPAPY